MKANEIKIVKPEPYMEINFRCSNRDFYNVKNELFDIWMKSELDEDEFDNGHISEKCDYEGDLEKIIIYNNDNISEFIENVCLHYEADYSKLEGMNLVLTC